MQPRGPAAAITPANAKHRLLAVAMATVALCVQGSTASAQALEVKIRAERVSADRWHVFGSTTGCERAGTVLFDTVELQVGGEPRDAAPLTDPETVLRVPAGSTFDKVVTWRPTDDATGVVIALTCDDLMPGPSPTTAWTETPNVVPTPPPNRPPVAVDDRVRIPAGGTLRLGSPGILKNDTDPDGDPLTAQLGRHTTLAANTRVRADGSVVIDFPDGWNGRACLEYTVSDPSGARSAPAFLRVTIGRPGPDVIADACRWLTAGEASADAAPGMIGRSRLRWYIAWEYPGQLFHTRRLFQSACWRESPWGSGRRGYLQAIYGRWTATYRCWRY